jgi:hypothetical protein
MGIRDKQHIKRYVKVIPSNPTRTIFMILVQYMRGIKITTKNNATNIITKTLVGARRRR